MSNKKISMNYNLSEQDLMNINYNQTNFTIENNMNIINNNNELNISGSSNDKSQENIIEIEQKNIHMLILQRSLFIMKKKFEHNKKEILLLYEKYKDQNHRKLKCINTSNLFNLYKEIMSTIQINFLPYENFNELITADLMSKFNEEKYITMINALVQFTEKNIEKYNTIFYENKMKKKKMREEKEKEKNLKSAEVVVTEQVKIVHKNKRGAIIDDFEKMIENNKKIDIDDIIFSINEDDMSILTNKKLLYNDVIPLIIADFLQEYMKNNIYIGIILTNNGLSNFENEELYENIKVLFDKEIIKKYNNLNKIDIKEEKKEKLKNLLFESNNIDNQIRIYNELIVENSNKGMESSYLLEMIRKLKEKKIVLQKKISEINKKKIILSSNMNTNNVNNNEYINTLNTNNNNINNISSVENIYYQSKLNSSKNNSKIHLKLNSKKLTKKEIREANLYEIFSFYCKQHMMIGRTPTIDQLLKKEKNMNLSEFAKFCIEFKIMVKNNKINEIFKKYTKNPTYMSFEEFKEALKRMSVLVNEEKKQYINERINIYQLKLQEMIEKEKKKKKKNKNKKNVKNPKKEKENNNNNNKEEEMKNEEPNVDKNENPTEKNEEKPQVNKSNEINNNRNIKNNKNIKNIKNNENKDKKEQKEEKEKKEEIKVSNENMKEEKIIENNNTTNEDALVNISQKIEEQETKKETKQITKNETKKEIKEEKVLILTSKEELETKISKLQEDYIKLDNKSLEQLEEEFYIYLEVDDNSVYRKKMVGYVQPFLTRGKDTRNPAKNVKHPVKFDKKNIRDMYDLLMQRQEELKKEMELKKMKEKDKQYEKRKRQFNKEIKKLEKDYGERIKKDNYKQIKKSEEDYIKEKNNKLTWQFIQKCDYNTFLLNEDGKNQKKNSIQSNLNDIFVNQSNLIFEKDDEDFINKVYSNKTSKKNLNYDDYLYNSKISSKISKNENYVKNSSLSIDINKKYKLGKRY